MGDTFVEETFERPDRKRALGGGRTARLKRLEDKLLFILVYFRLYPTQAVQRYLSALRKVRRMNGYTG